MRWVSHANSVLVLVPLACTRANPGFGDGSGTGSGTDETSSATLDPSGVATSVDASNSDSDSDTDSDTTPTDPTADSSDTAVDTGDMPRCGDGTKQEDLGEECDDGDVNNHPEANCQDDCTENECGDMLPAPNQPCDDGPGGSKLCTPECELLSCGNEKFEPELGEECEPTSGTTDCTSFCTLNECGDGETLEEEECEDNNLEDTDACVACQDAFCGDGHLFLDGDEQCDDENDDDTDECVACQFAFCGDGSVFDGFAGDEECDDSNREDTDECVACQFAFCGDGHLFLDEESCEVGDITECLAFDLVGADDVLCQDKNCQWAVAATCCVGVGDPCTINEIDCCSGACEDEFCVAQ